MNGTEFQAWVMGAPPGDSVIYHTGYLPWDRRNPINRRVAEAANAAWWAYEQRLVALVQRRLGDLKFEYIAIKSRPKGAPA